MRLDYSTFTREWVLSPRLGLRYALTDGLLGRAGWGFYHQAPDFVGLFERFEREIEWNLFETIVLKTERAQHFTAGLEWDRGQAHGARLEGYYKRLDHLVAARDSTWQSIPDNSGRGHAYGLELFLQRRPSAATRLSGWISYSLGVSKEGNPREPLHYRDVDQRHTLDLVGRLGLTRRSWLDVRYSYGSGFPWTPVARGPDGEPLFDDEGRVVREPVNSRRYPAYRRLDVRLSWRRGLRRRPHADGLSRGHQRPQPQERLRVLLGRRLRAPGQLHAADDALLRAAPGLLIAGGDLDRVRPYSRSLERNRHQASSRKMTLTSRA